MNALDQIPFDPVDRAQIDESISTFHQSEHIQLDMEVSAFVLTIQAVQQCFPYSPFLPKHQITAHARAIFEGQLPKGYTYRIITKPINLLSTEKLTLPDCYQTPESAIE